MKAPWDEGAAAVHGSWRLMRAALRKSFKSFNNAPTGLIAACRLSCPQTLRTTHSAVASMITPGDHTLGPGWLRRSQAPSTKHQAPSSKHEAPSSKHEAPRRSPPAAFSILLVSVPSCWYRCDRADLRRERLSAGWSWVRSELRQVDLLYGRKLMRQQPGVPEFQQPGTRAARHSVTSRS